MVIDIPNPSIDSIAKMKAALPRLRKKLNTDPAYFKTIYMHTFDLSKKEGARVLALDTALDMWSLFIPPALAARPSALSHVPSGSNPTGPATSEPAAFGTDDLDLWLDYQRNRGKAISKDTWSLFIDFIRTIDAEFKDYDEEGALFRFRTDPSGMAIHHRRFRRVRAQAQGGMTNACIGLY